MTEPESLPFVLAMLLCDVAITEAGSNKKTLVGIFDKIMTRAVPATHAQFWLYAKLADLRGRHDIRIDLIHLETEKQIATMNAVANTASHETTENFDFALPLPPITFPLEGSYEFQLFADNIFIGRAVVTVNIIVPSGGAQV